MFNSQGLRASSRDRKHRCRRIISGADLAAKHREQFLGHMGGQETLVRSSGKRKTSFWANRPTGSSLERGSRTLACHFKPKQFKLALVVGAPLEFCFLERGSRGKGDAPFPGSPNPRSTQAFAPLRRLSVDDAEHFLHDHHASV
jgi:hypothetical protein